jgi:2-polyprenyl-3-methyl-5-hydroxy-6-metoxy-1,4-benzoquinol methylase
MAQEERFDSYITQHYAAIRSPFQRRDRVKDRLWHRYGRFIPVDKDTQILDIGPGFGEFIELLRQDRSYRNVKAVDISREVVEFCNKLFPESTSLTDDTIAYLLSRQGHFNVISLFHVLEHIPKEGVVPFLTSIRETLRPGGRLLIEVPNMANIFTGLHVRYADFTHEVGFTETSLHYVLQRAGFQQIQIFEASLPYNHWSRPIQFVLQRMIKVTLRLMLMAYGTHAPYLYRVITPELCCVAVA